MKGAKYHSYLYKIHHGIPREPCSNRQFRAPKQTLYRTYLFLYFTSTGGDKKKYSCGASSSYSKEADVQLNGAYLKLILKVLASAKIWNVDSKHSRPQSFAPELFSFCAWRVWVEIRTREEEFSYPPLKNFYDKTRMSRVDVLFPCARRNMVGTRRNFYT